MCSRPGPARPGPAQLLRGGAEPVLVADLLGHASLDTVRAYAQPDDADRERALGLLTTDQ